MAVLTNKPCPKCGMPLMYQAYDNGTGWAYCPNRRCDFDEQCG